MNTPEPTPAVSVRTAALTRLDAIGVTATATRIPGIIALEVYGATAPKELRSRTVAALNSLTAVPPFRVMVDFECPTPKEVTACASLDLAATVAVLALSGRVPPKWLQGTAFIGNITHEGGLLGPRGVTPLVEALACDPEVERIVLPRESFQEAERALCRESPMGVRTASGRPRELVPVGELAEVVEYLQADEHPERLRPATPLPPYRGQYLDGPDLADLPDGNLVRALAVAAAGAHNVVIFGESMHLARYARALAALLPPPTDAESQVLTRIRSAAGVQFPEGGVVARPFRAPHYTASGEGLCGRHAPGEFGLAHGGVLYLDAAPEFPIESLRLLAETMEDRDLRACWGAPDPADYQLVMSSKLCPCGRYGHASGAVVCACSPERIQKYRARIPQRVQDRVDIFVRLDPSKHNQKPTHGLTTAMVRRFVRSARERQNPCPNGKLPIEPPILGHKATFGHRSLATFAGVALDRAGAEYTARELRRAERVACTLADINGASEITEEDVREALSYQTKMNALPVLP